MPLACLTAVAGGLSVGPGVRSGFVVSAFDSTLGQRARGFWLSASRVLGVASADSADSPNGFLRITPRCRWLAVVESGQWLASRAVEAGQPGAAVDRGVAFSSARGIAGQINLRTMGLAGGGFAPAPASTAQVQPT